jgi:hypothetical protein
LPTRLNRRLICFPLGLALFEGFRPSYRWSSGKSRDGGKKQPCDNPCHFIPLASCPEPRRETEAADTIKFFVTRWVTRGFAAVL